MLNKPLVPRFGIGWKFLLFLLVAALIAALAWVGLPLIQEELASPVSSLQEVALASSQLTADPPVFLPILLKDYPALVGPTAQYVLLGWNDLGMHCYNRDFQDLAVLPPYNTLWAQVVKRGDPPQVVTQGVTVEYSFPDNTYSAGIKSNFWQYAQALFGLPQPLPENTGLTGKGLAGAMDAKSSYFEAQGIPLTEYSDSAPYSRYPYQKALLVARDAVTHQPLASLTVVAPVSTEMHCEYCHSDGQREGIATGRVETNILTLHDRENAEDYPAGYTGGLMSHRPVLCAACHSSNALGTPGVGDIPSLSNAMHRTHAEQVTNDLQGCYSCHPGPSTKCLRDVMSSQFDMNCISCHGSMSQVAQNPTPWLKEPVCSDCHGPKNGMTFTQDQALYRNSKGHGGLYCESCHDSTHAIAPSTQINDGIKFIQLQGHSGPLDTCTLCHLTQPTGPGPHE